VTQHLAQKYLVAEINLANKKSDRLDERSIKMKPPIQKSSEEKLSIILEGLKGESTVSEICSKYGVS
jgi:hypothetical protein